MISEAHIIHWIKVSFPKHIGHNTAEIGMTAGLWSMMTKDLLEAVSKMLENPHFGEKL